MALNKILEGMLRDFSSTHCLQDLELTKQFEYLVNYLIVSKYHPEAFSDKCDLDMLVVDDKGQFGLDAVAFVVNGNLVLSKEDIKVYSKSNKLDVDIIFIQSKTSEKCETGDLLKTIQATKFFLNEFDEIVEKNENILNAKEIYDELFDYENYKHCTSESPKCHIYYVTTANEWDVDLVNGICNSVEREIKASNSDIKSVEVKVLGREYVIESYNEITNSVTARINLKNCITLEKIEGVKEAYLGYLSGQDYLNIICDLDGEIRRRIFYDNVRDYQGIGNHVNMEIRNTIDNDRTKDKFILLNNGVTIIAKSVVSLGANEYEISDFQIVNGCQTSNEIFNCKDKAKDIFVPVKIIYTIEPEIISDIVKATNRQSPVPEEAFVALETYHKELQQLFSRYSEEMPLEMFYERRSGEKDDIKDKNGNYQIVTLHGLIRSVESVYFQKPNVVLAKNPANILKEDREKLFCKSHKQEMYYVASYLFLYFIHLQQKGVCSRKDYALRYYVIMVARCLMAKRNDVPAFESKEMLKESQLIIKILKQDGESYFVKSKEIVKSVMKEERFKNKNEREILRSAEFCERVKTVVREYLGK